MDAQREIIPNDSASSQADNNGNVSPIELTNATGTYLQTLPELCQLKIFSHLSPLDLCSIAETCRRFKQLSDCVFPKEFEIDVEPEMYRNAFVSDTHSIYYESSRDIRRILKHFGSRLCTLKISRIDRIVINSAKYCDAGTLKGLVIRGSQGMRIIENLNSKFKSIFEHLLSLSIQDLFMANSIVKSMPLNCDSLTSLELNNIGVSAIEPILRNTFPKLERFFLTDFAAGVIDFFIEFIQRHKGMKSLYFRMELHCFDDEFLRAVGDNCKELEELTITSVKFNRFTPPMDLSALHCLTKLRKLDIDCSYKNEIQLVSLLKALQSLKMVVLSCIKVTDELADALSQLQNLRELQFKRFILHQIPWEMLPQLTKLCFDGVCGQLDRNDILGIMWNLENLEELVIMVDGSGDLIEKWYCKIVEIIDLRPTNIVLTITSRFSEKFLENCNENRKLKLKNLI